MEIILYWCFQTHRFDTKCNLN